MLCNIEQVNSGTYNAMLWTKDLVYDITKGATTIALLAKPRKNTRLKTMIPNH